MASAICARWGARLSALIVRGNAAVHRLALPAEVMEHRPWCEGAPALPHLLPHGSCLYEVLCMRQPGFAGEEEDAGCGDARAAGGEWEDTRGARGLARGTWEGAGDAGNNFYHNQNTPITTRTLLSQPKKTLLSQPRILMEQKPLLSQPKHSYHNQDTPITTKT